MEQKKFIQQEIDWSKSVVHTRENSQANEDHLNSNRFHFLGQCALVLSLLQNGVRLTSRSAMVQHHIGHLARRIADLKEAGVPIKDDFVMDAKGKKTRYKEYFLES